MFNDFFEILKKVFDTLFGGLFKGVFDTDMTVSISALDFFVCLGCALLCGLILAGCYMIKAKYTKSFATTLALIPAIVAVVIMMVNGTIGAGVAVAGAFSLVRFRSAPGSAREIGAVFIAMGAGLVAGRGYIAYAIIISVLLGVINLIYNLIMSRKGGRNKKVHKILKITIPEDLDYCGVFDDILSKYTKDHELVRVKTANMGSLFKLTYNVTIKGVTNEKELIDKLRERNGNLEISLSRQEMGANEL